MFILERIIGLSMNDFFKKKYSVLQCLWQIPLLSMEDKHEFDFANDGCEQLHAGPKPHSLILG